MTGVSAVDQNMEIVALPVPVLYYGVPVEASGGTLTQYRYCRHACANLECYSIGTIKWISDYVDDRSNHNQSNLAYSN